MTLNGVMAVVLRYLMETVYRFGAMYVKVVEVRSILSATKSNSKNLVFACVWWTDGDYVYSEIRLLRKSALKTGMRPTRKRTFKLCNIVRPSEQQ